MPKFSLLIPEWPQVVRPMAMDYIDQLDCPKGDLEIIIAKGYQPCRQRYECLTSAEMAPVNGQGSGFHAGWDFG